MKEQLSFKLIAHAFNAHNENLKEPLSLQSVQEIMDLIEHRNLGCVDWVSDVEVYDDDEAYFDSLDGSPLTAQTVFNLTEQNHVVVVKHPSKMETEGNSNDKYRAYLTERLLDAYPDVARTEWMVEKLVEYIDHHSPGFHITKTYLDNHLEFYQSLNQFINMIERIENTPQDRYTDRVMETYNLVSLSLLPGGRVARLTPSVR